MIKQIFLPIILVAIFIVAVGIYIKKAPNLPSPLKSPIGQAQKVVKIESKEIFVEIADTSELRAKGLSGKATLEENYGMLFVFPSPDNFSSFWMKDMKIPLDIIWINDGKIADIDKNVPIPTENTPDSALPIYSANGKYDFVLEVNAGYSDKNGIKVGDSVILPAL